MTEETEPGFYAIDAAAIKEFVQSYITLRDAQASALKISTESHMRFNAFLNDQAKMFHAKLGDGIGEVELRDMRDFQETGLLPLGTPELDEGFAQLLNIRIEYLRITRALKAKQN